MPQWNPTKSSHLLLGLLPPWTIPLPAIEKVSKALILVCANLQTKQRQGNRIEDASILEKLGDWKPFCNAETDGESRLGCSPHRHTPGD